MDSAVIGPALRRTNGGGARRDIQGLRALAVVAVIAEHLFHWPAGGFVGVDVFFVISGFLITGLLLREHGRRGSISFTGFYVRRFKRIIPNAVLVIAATVYVSGLLLGGNRLTSVRGDSVWALFFAANWRFAVQGTDYFQQDVPPSPLQHFWSLAVEEQFYFVWPWVVLGLLALSTRLLGWDRRRQVVVIGSLMAVVVVASFAWAIHQSATAVTVAYFSTFTRAWELGIGALVAIAVGARQPSVHSRSAVALRSSLGWLGLAGIVASLFLIRSSAGFPAPAAALPVLSTALVIAAGHGFHQPYLWPLTNRVSGYLGDISYSLYLWHWPVVVLLVTLFRTDDPAYYVVALLATAALSVASYHLVEDPVRKSSWLTVRKRADRPRRQWPLDHERRIALVTAAVLVLVAVPVGVAVRNRQPVDDYVPAASAGDPAQDPERCWGAASLDPALACSPTELGQHLRPDPQRLAEDAGHSCWIDTGESPKNCSYGSEDPAATVFALVGDSHAQSLLPALVPQFEARNWRLDVFVGNGCQWRTPAGYNCTKAMPQIQKRLESGSPYAAVLTTASRKYAGTDSSLYVDAWSPVAAMGVPIIAIADNPSVSEEALQCVTRVTFSVEDSDCGMSKDEALSSKDPLIDAVKQVPGAKLVDLMPYYCPESTCPAVIGHEVVYRDSGSHLTASYASSLAPYLMAGIQGAIG